MRTRGEALTRACGVITDAFVNSMLTQTTLKPRYTQYKGTTILPVNGGRVDQTRKDRRSRTPRETTPELGEQDSWIQRRVEERRASQSPNRQDRNALRRRCGSTRWNNLMRKGQFWMTGQMKEIGTEMNGPWFETAESR